MSCSVCVRSVSEVSNSSWTANARLLAFQKEEAENKKKGIIFMIFH